jgi:hypothetical protein
VVERLGLFLLVGDVVGGGFWAESYVRRVTVEKISSAAPPRAVNATGRRRPHTADAL